MLVSLMLLLCATVAWQSPPASPTVQLDDAAVTGTVNGSTWSFLGIPFALPPTGHRRLRLPEPVHSYNRSFTANEYGFVCPQQALNASNFTSLPGEAQEFIGGVLAVPLPEDNEDCLTINVIVPSSMPPDSRLPVAVWMFGGGFEVGGPSATNGTVIVERSIEIGEPIIYVSMNYRLSAFGWIGGKEVKEAGIANLGLHDQREALRWVQKYIGAFGGDPQKVTIWGLSAGAISVGLHFVANNGDSEGLFRAAFMHSGSPLPVGPVDSDRAQFYYDNLVSDAGCANANDTLQCLRELPYEILKPAVDKSPSLFSYESLMLAWMPRVDGTLLTDVPMKLAARGKVAQVPFVSGDTDDEGTMFSVSSLNVTTSEETEEYFQRYWYPDASPSELEALWALYPSNAADGSPYDTGANNTMSPQFKRIASIVGDSFFQGPRRVLLEATSRQQDVWGFSSKRLKSLPGLGAAHSSDMLNIFGGGELTNYFIHFVTSLDPNGADGNLTQWPKYEPGSRNLLTLLDGPVPITVTQDDFRQDAIAFVSDLSLEHPF